MVTYGLTLENQQCIQDRAKSQKNGVYRFRGVAYKVWEGMVTLLAWDGVVYQPHTHFNVQLGRYDVFTDNREVLKRTT